MKHFVITIMRHFGVSADTEEGAQAYCDEIAADMGPETLVFMEELEGFDGTSIEPEVIH